MKNAFPTTEKIKSFKDDRDVYLQKGMNLREYAAIKAMQGILADHSVVQPNQCEEISKLAVQNADALLQELEKQEQE